MLKLIEINILLAVVVFFCGCKKESETSSTRFKASSSANVNATKNIECRDMFIKQIGAYRLTELGNACHSDDLARVLELLNDGACHFRCITDDIYEYDLLYTCLTFGKFQIARMLIENEVYSGVNFVYDENATTPLTLVSKIKDKDIAKEFSKKLLAAGANVNGASSHGGENISYPIIFAVKNNNIGLVKLLISHGVDKNVTDNEGYTPIQWATEFGSAEMVKLLK